MVAAWIRLAAGIVLLGAAYVANDVPVLAVLLMIAVPTALFLVIEGPEVPEAHNVAPMPSTFLMKERRRWGPSEVVALVALVALVVGVLCAGGPGLRLVLGGLVFADGVAGLIRRRAIAKWEDEHDLELLRERRETSRRDRRYYGRPRTPH